MVDKAKSAGHTVVPWEPFNHGSAVDFASKFYTSDAGHVSFWTRPVELLLISF